MPRNIIQNLLIIVGLIIIFRIIIAIVQFNRRDQRKIQQNRKYTLEEIVENHETIEERQRIENFIKRIPNLDKIREENWELLQIRLKAEILLRKIKKKFEKTKNFLNNLFSTKRKSQTKIKRSKDATNTHLPDSRAQHSPARWSASRTGILGNLPRHTR